MRVADLSPLVLRLAFVATGLVAGAIATQLATHLPKRYDVAHLVTGPRRTRRNGLLVFGCALVALGLATVTLRHASATVGEAGLYLGTNLVVASLLLAAASVDVEHLILPNELTIGAALVALASAHFRSVGIVGSLVGAVLGGVITLVPFFVYKKLRGYSGMGLGDATLAVAAGAWLGAEGAFFTLFAGAFQNVVCAVLLRALGIGYTVPESVRAELERLRRRADEGDEDAKRELDADPMAASDTDTDRRAHGLGAMRLPFGPFLVLASIEFLFFGKALIDAFLRFGDER